MKIPEIRKKNCYKKYPGYPALYIDSKGGVFTADAQPNWVKDAILYTKSVITNNKNLQIWH